MINTPYKNRRKEAIPIQDLHSRHRLNLPTPANSASSLYTQKLGGGGQNLCLLTPLLIILAVIISSSCSSGEETKSSQGEITELTVTINSTDYSITFDADKTKTVIIPYGSTLPAEITVKSVAISAKASGLATNDTLKISSGKTDITITAEDGSPTVYTLTVEVEAAPLLATVLARSELMVGSLQPDNYWANIFPFSIKAIDATRAGKYRLAVRPTSANEPTATEIRSSVATVARNLSTNSINVLMSFHMDTDLFDVATDWRQGGWGEGSALLDKAKAARLQPNTSYTLYAVRSTNDDTVYSLLSFTTDAELIPADLDTLGITGSTFFNFPLDFTNSTGALGYAFTIRSNEPFLLPVGIVNPIAAVTVLIASTTISICDNTANNCLPSVNGPHDIFSQTLMSPSDTRIVPFIVGSKSFSDSLISSGMLTYTLVVFNQSRNFNMRVETE